MNDPAADGLAREQEESLGLSIDMLDADRLRDWARLIDEFGYDISNWGDRAFISAQLRRIADGVAQTVRDVGTLRAVIDTLRAQLREAQDADIAQMVRQQVDLALENKRLTDALTASEDARQQAQEQIVTLTARAVAAERHKALELLSKGSAVEQLEMKLRTELAETQLALEASEALASLPAVTPEEQR
jgi:hypothetical protein